MGQRGRGGTYRRHAADGKTYVRTYLDRVVLHVRNGEMECRRVASRRHLHAGGRRELIRLQIATESGVGDIDELRVAFRGKWLECLFLKPVKIR